MFLTHDVLARRAMRMVGVGGDRFWQGSRVRQSFADNLNLATWRRQTCLLGGTSSLCRQSGETDVLVERLVEELSVGRC